EDVPSRAHAPGDQRAEQGPDAGAPFGAGGERQGDQGGREGSEQDERVRAQSQRGARREFPRQPHRRDEARPGDEEGEGEERGEGSSSLLDPDFTSDDRLKLRHRVLHGYRRKTIGTGPKK